MKYEDVQVGGFYFSNKFHHVCCVLNKTDKKHIKGVLFTHHPKFYKLPENINKYDFNDTYFQQKLVNLESGSLRKLPKEKDYELSIKNKKYILEKVK